MPISKDEWSAGRTWETREAQILTFLKQNQAKAFTVSDIASSIGQWTGRTDFWGFLGNVAALWGVQNALENLVKEGTVKAKIVKKQIEEETYYMIS